MGQESTPEEEELVALDDGGDLPVKRGPAVREPAALDEDDLDDDETVRKRKALTATINRIQADPARNSAAAKAANNLPVMKVVGNVYRSTATKALLRMFGRSDFKHDFGEGDEGRDLVTKADRTRFQEMVQLYPVKQRVAMLNEFDALLAKNGGRVNLYQLLSSRLATMLFPEAAETGPAEIETKVMANMGIMFEEEVKKLIKDHFAGVGAGNKPPHEATYEFKPQNIYSGGASTRKYIVRAQKYKIDKGTGEQTRNLSSLFKDVTGGGTKFALLVDAASGLSLTSVRNAALPGREATVTPCSFIMLNSIEGDADSASGVNDFRETRDTKSPPAPVPDFKVMRDVDTSTSIFPTWPDAEAPSAAEAENLFTKIKIILNRVEKGEIEASILLGGQTINIPDVGKASNVKNASLNALASRFAAKILRAASEDTDPKQYIYALLKRMGDWCQALCLLDRTRTYRSVDIKTGAPLDPKFERTLAQLVAEGYEIGVVTNDRILLSFAIFLGLNVYYTTAADVACLVYFKNQDDLPSAVDVLARAKTLFAEFESAYGPPPGVAVASSSNPYPGLTSLYTEYADTLQPPDFDTIEGYVFQSLQREFSTPPPGVNRAIKPGLVAALASKVVLSNLGELRTGLTDLRTKIDTAIAAYRSVPDTETDAAQIKKKFDAVKDLWSLVAKLRTDVEYNATVVNDQLHKGKYSKSKDDPTIVFGELAKKMNSGGRITTSEAMARAKDILLSARDDIKQIRQKKFDPPLNLNAYIPSLPVKNPTAGQRPNDRDIENFAALYGAFEPVRAEIGPLTGGGKQRGGLRPNLVDRLKQRHVFPYDPSKSVEITVNNLNKTISEGRMGEGEERARLDRLENLPLVPLRDRVRDDKTNAYTIVDKYLITKEDIHILSDLVKDIVDPASTSDILKDKDDGFGIVDLNFILYRYLLLYHDMLYNRLERLNDETGLEFLGSEGGRVKTKNINTDYTEGFSSNIRSIAHEAGILRIFCSILTVVGRDAFSAENLNNTKSILSQLEAIRNEGVSREQLDILLATPGTVTPADTATLRGILGAGGYPTMSRLINTALDNIRVNLMDAYGDGFQEEEKAAVDAILENDPEWGELGGGSRLDSDDGLTSNAGLPSSGGVLPDGRRGLYARLWKRSGSGSPPGI